MANYTIAVTGDPGVGRHQYLCRFTTGDYQPRSARPQIDENITVYTNYGPCHLRFTIDLVQAVDGEIVLYRTGTMPPPPVDINIPRTIHISQDDNRRYPSGVSARTWYNLGEPVQNILRLIRDQNDLILVEGPAVDPYRIM